ncbi:MAG: ABC transporter ATP-binding protein [Clostridia bacterium]|nr:ABC transporter ATP-binding protein [Clostridia bacterium]
MIDFIKTAEKGVLHSHKNSIELKKALAPELKEALEYFKAGDIDHKKAAEYVKALSNKANIAIDKLCVKKNSTEYVFHSAFATAVKEYFDGIKNNPIEEKIYLKNKKKYDAIIAKGEEPDWVLKPQVVVDLDLKLANICKVIENLYNSYVSDIANTNAFEPNAHVVEIIDFLKEQASKLVVQMNKKIAKAKAIKLLEEVGIPEPATRFNQYPFEFSGGMRQRIVIAIALSANPDILICDEPTTALDVTIQAQILELINKIKEERKLSVIFITHNLGVVANMADRIAVMYAGKIVEMGTAEEIFYEPAHPYTWALLSSMPDLHTKERLESIPGTPPNMIYPPKGDAFAARNKYALEIDFEMEPPLFEITETHTAATWLLHPNAPKVEMPKIIKERIERLKKERN